MSSYTVKKNGFAAFLQGLGGVVFAIFALWFAYHFFTGFIQGWNESSNSRNTGVEYVAPAVIDNNGGSL